MHHVKETIFIELGFSEFIEYPAFSHDFHRQKVAPMFGYSYIERTIPLTEMAIAGSDIPEPYDRQGAGLKTHTGALHQILTRSQRSRWKLLLL